MDLRPIPARDWADWYTGELCASCPACECKPLEAIRALARRITASNREDGVARAIDRLLEEN